MRRDLGGGRSLADQSISTARVLGGRAGRAGGSPVGRGSKVAGRALERATGAKKTEGCPPGLPFRPDTYPSPPAKYLSCPGPMLGPGHLRVARGRLAPGVGTGAGLAAPPAPQPTTQRSRQCQERLRLAAWPAVLWWFSKVLRPRSQFSFLLFRTHNRARRHRPFLDGLFPPTVLLQTRQQPTGCHLQVAGPGLSNPRAWPYRSARARTPVTHSLTPRRPGPRHFGGETKQLPSPVPPRPVLWHVPGLPAARCPLLSARCPMPTAAAAEGRCSAAIANESGLGGARMGQPRGG